MLNDRFLSRLGDEFPQFYSRVAEQAAEDAVRIRDSVGGDVEKALVGARFASAGRLWWPYVKGTVGKDRDAMEAFTRLVLTVDHLAGYDPLSMEDARRQVVDVLRNSVDVERLRKLLKSDKAAAGGIVASMTALLAPIGAARTAWKWLRWLPDGALIAAGAVAVAAVLSIPLLAGYSAGHQAERHVQAFHGFAPSEARDIRRAT